MVMKLAFVMDDQSYVTAPIFERGGLNSAGNQEKTVQLHPN